jgi:hypothetical protein
LLTIAPRRPVVLEALLGDGLDEIEPRTEPGRRNVAGCAKRIYGVAEWD